MREQLLDILKHTNGLGSFIEIVKVTGTEDKTLFEAIDKDKTIIVKASLKSAIPDFEGEFGMMNLPLLQGLLNHAPYKAEKASIEVKTADKGGKTPVEITLKNEHGKNPATYRFVGSNLIPSQATMKNSNWDIVFEPTDSKIQEFASLAILYACI